MNRTAYVQTYICIYRLCMYELMCTYVCMYVCMYVRTYACVCMCTYIHTYVCMYVSTYVCMYAYMYVRMRVYVCVYLCMHVCMYGFTDDPNNEGNKHIWSICQVLRDYTAQYPRRLIFIVVAVKAWNLTEFIRFESSPGNQLLCL
jgi:hypothetical protein